VNNTNHHASNKSGGRRVRWTGAVLLSFISLFPLLFNKKEKKRKRQGFLLLTRIADVAHFQPLITTQRLDLRNCRESQSFHNNSLLCFMSQVIGPQVESFENK
jgi:hypothetical protein